MAEFGQDGIEHDRGRTDLSSTLSSRNCGCGPENPPVVGGSWRAFGALARVRVTAQREGSPAAAARRDDDIAAPSRGARFCLTDDRPEPGAPPKRCAMPTLACENGRNRRLISPSARPIAAIRYYKGDADPAFGSPQRRCRQRDHARFGELHGVCRSGFPGAARSRTGSPTTNAGRLLGDFDGRLQAFLPPPRPASESPAPRASTRRSNRSWPHPPLTCCGFRAAIDE